MRKSVRKIECPLCGSMVPPGVDFCPECGTRIETVVPSVVDHGSAEEHDTSSVKASRKASKAKSAKSKIECHVCGSVIPPDVYFCPECGTRIQIEVPSGDDHASAREQDTSSVNVSRNASKAKTTGSDNDSGQTGLFKALLKVFLTVTVPLLILMLLGFGVYYLLNRDSADEPYSMEDSYEPVDYDFQESEDDEDLQEPEDEEGLQESDAFVSNQSVGESAPQNLDFQAVNPVPVSGTDKIVVNNWAIVEQDYFTKLVVEFTNVSNEIIPDFEAQFVFYDADGQVVEMAEDGHDVVLPGSTVVTETYVSESVYEYETFEIMVDTEKYTNDYVNHADKLSITDNTSDNTIYLQVTNNDSVEIDEIEIVVVCYDEYNSIIWSAESEEYGLAPGNMVVMEFYCDDLSWADHYEYYINQAHTF